jgi:hypothetical protein
MTVTVTALHKQAQLDSVSTDWGAGALLRLYNGSVPTDVNTALGAQVVLAVVTPTPAAATAAGAGATKDMLGGTKTTTGTASASTGTNATFYRVYKSDGTTVKEQGTITATGGGGDMTLDNINIAQNQTVNVTAFTKSIA